VGGHKRQETGHKRKRQEKGSKEKRELILKNSMSSSPDLDSLAIVSPGECTPGILTFEFEDEEEQVLVRRRGGSRVGHGQEKEREEGKGVERRRGNSKNTSKVD